MKQSNWIRPFIRITSAAVFTSVVSSGLSFLLLTSFGDWSKISGQEVIEPYTISQQVHRSFISSKGSIYMEQRHNTIQPALHHQTQEPELKTIQKAVADAVKALAKHKPFAAWKGAMTEIEALGPGTHGFVVHITSADHKRLGYLVIHATEDGDYSLTEYGTGEYYPFAKDTLSEAIQELGWSAHDQKRSTATPYYIKPMLAVWKLELQENTHWLDASSGDILPELSVIKSGVQYASMTAVNAVSRTSFSMTRNHVIVTNSPVVHSFDPYDQIGWMSDQALHWSGYQAQHKLQHWNPIKSKEKLIYVQSLKTAGVSSSNLNFPYAISGEQLWKVGSNEDVVPQQTYRYIALTAPGKAEVRFISESYLLSSGYITANPVSQSE